MAQDLSMVGLNRAKSVLHLVGRGLGVAYAAAGPGTARARPLFPWPPRGPLDDAAVWCNGRMALPDYERRPTGRGTRRRERCTGEGWFARL